MKESNVTTDFKHYLTAYPPQRTETYELKLVNLAKQKSFAFDRVAEHQVIGLNNSLSGLWLKIPDTAAINGFSSQKPFDVIWMNAFKASVIVVFYMPRRFKKAIKIPVDKFVQLKDTWPKKSIRMEDLEIQEGVEVFLI